jgi:hypothetical protein
MKVLGKTLITSAIAALAPMLLGASAQTAATNKPTVATMLGASSYSNILSPVDFRSKDINLTKGRPIAEGISIGSSKLKDFSPASANAATGAKLDLSKVRLSELKFLKETPLKSVVDANPAIAKLKAAEVGWILHGRGFANERGNKTLGELAGTDVGQKPLPDSVLKGTSIGQFGDIANTPYSNYTQAATQPIANFLGAADIPLNKLSSSSSAGAGKVIDRITVDRIATREFATAVDPRISSGSNKEPHAPCKESANNCNVLEIRGQTKGVTGSLWIVNQKLTGGSGMVGEAATAAGIREYAGYEIPGTDFKIVAIADDARAGTAQLRLDMRTSSLLGSTPYFIPVSTITVSEKHGAVPFPVEVSPIASIANPSTAPTTAAAAVLTNNSQPTSESGTKLPTVDSQADNPNIQADKNIQNGNIGRAVKTNAINPAIGGLL